MKKTTHFELLKPEGADNVRVDDFNSNMDDIDTMLYEQQQGADTNEDCIERLQTAVNRHAPLLALALRHDGAATFFMSQMLVADFSRAGEIDEYAHVDFDGNKPLAPDGWAGTTVDYESRFSLNDAAVWYTVGAVKAMGAGTLTAIHASNVYFDGPALGVHSGGRVRFRVKNSDGAVLSTSPYITDIAQSAVVSCSLESGKTYTLEANTDVSQIFLGGDEPHHPNVITYTATPVGYANGYVITHEASLPKGRFSVFAVAANSAPTVYYEQGGSWVQLTLQESEVCVNSDGQTATLYCYDSAAVVAAGATRLKLVLASECRLDGVAAVKV